MTRSAAFLLVLLLPALACADAVVTSAPVPTTTGASLVLLACAAVSYGLRRISPQGAFFHTQLGTVSLAVIGALIGAVSGVVQEHGLDWRAIAQAGIATLVALFATSNPSVPVGAKPPMRTVGAYLIPLMLFGALVPGCASWRTCVVGKLSQPQQTVAIEVAAALATENYVGVLEDLANEYGEPAVTCTVQAIVDAKQKKAAAAAPTLVKAATRPDAVLDHGLDYLSTHKKTACADVLGAA